MRGQQETPYIVAMTIPHPGRWAENLYSNARRSLAWLSTDGMLGLMLPERAAEPARPVGTRVTLNLRGWASRGALLLSLACASGPAKSDASTGGSSPEGGAGSSASAGNTSAAGTGTGATRGSSSAGSEGAQALTGGAPSGGAPERGGTSGVGAGAGAPPTRLPPPSQCHNQDYIDVQQGCRIGDPTSLCGGKCTTINACQESLATKPDSDVTFICPRFMLFSDQMIQAAADDGNSAFNYAVVGHDTDRGGIDGQAESTCCQCYQLVFAYPSPHNDRQGQKNPDDPNPPSSAIAIPPPLIVQSFNTAATPTTFDVYMAAGGLGANNACAPALQPQAQSGQYLYTGYPPDGQSSQGGVKPASLYSECKTERSWVTTETLSSDSCQSRVQTACNQLESEIPGLTEQARRSCLQANHPASFYHLNWSVYAMKIECPEHLTRVTGCRLEPQGLPSIKRDVTTAEQAAVDPGFWSKTSGEDRMYETTTMEDCCRPSCASVNWIEKKGLRTDSQYNAFYSCDPAGNPITE